MSDSVRGIKLYLDDIRDSIRKIEKYTRGASFEKFSHDEKSIDAIARNILTIGEAADHIPKEIKEKNPDVVWKEIKGMRNKIVHEYFGVDVEILWKTVQEDIPVFKKQIAKLLKSL